MKRYLIIVWLCGAICLANNEAAANPWGTASPYGFSSAGRIVPQGLGVTYGGQIFGTGAGPGRSSFLYSGYGRERTVASQATTFALVQPAVYSYVVGPSFVSSETVSVFPDPVPVTPASSSGGASLPANTSVAAPPPAGPGQLSVASQPNPAVSRTTGINGAAGAFWNSASDPRLRRLFRWSEGHVLIVLEDAAPFMLPISESPPNYGDVFDASLVVQVKQILSKQGYYGGPMDGIVGPSLHRAIQDYQKDHKLEITGSLDAPFLQSLGMLDNASEIDDSSIPAKNNQP